jgi:hypothetical protein
MKDSRWCLLGNGSGLRVALPTAISANRAGHLALVGLQIAGGSGAGERQYLVSRIVGPSATNAESRAAYAGESAAGTGGMLIFRFDSRGNGRAAKCRSKFPNFMRCGGFSCVSVCSAAKGVTQLASRTRSLFATSGHNGQIPVRRPTKPLGYLSCRHTSPQYRLDAQVRNRRSHGAGDSLRIADRYIQRGWLHGRRQSRAQ